MRKKISPKRPLYIASIGWAAIFSLIFSLTFIFPVQNSSANPALPASVQTLNTQKVSLKSINPEIPARLQIPKIKIDIALESVGLTFQGAVDVPKGHANAAWYNLGPRPGDNGSAVITGHYGIWKNGTPTVFNNLSKLRPGDKIYIKDKKGTIITFVVRELKAYGPSDDVTKVFNSSDGQAHLNLITCQGAWNKLSQSYPKRLVVFTDRVK